MSGLIGWWPLHENSGSTARDLSGNGNHGSLNGGVTQGVAGKAGLQAMNFNGSDSYVSIPTVSSDFKSISLWFKPGNEFTGDDSAEELIGRSDSTGTDIILGNVSSSTSGETLSINNSGATSIDNSISAEWHHAVFNWNGSTYDIFLDGERRSKLTSDASLISSLSIAFGARVSNSDLYYAGNISDVRIYDRALTPQEIQELYEQSSGDFTTRSLSNGSDSGAVSRWKFDNENSNSGEALDSWSGNNGSISGSSYTEDSFRNQGKALRMSDGDEVVYDNQQDFDFSSSDSFTISVWGYFDKSSGNVYVIDKLDGQGYYIASRGTESGSPDIVDVIIQDDTGNRIRVNMDMLWDRWLNLVCTYDGSESASGLKVFVNGVRQETSIISDDSLGNISNSTNPKTICSPGTYSASATISDLRIYNRTLKPYEVFELYQWGTRGRDMRKQLVNKR